jgi:hypothetical protein
MTSPGTATRPQTAQLLVLLHDYVVAHTAAHPALIPAVLALRDAAQAFGRGELQRAHDHGVTVYRMLQSVRATSADLPEP